MSIIKTFSPNTDKIFTYLSGTLRSIESVPVSLIDRTVHSPSGTDRKS